MCSTLLLQHNEASASIMSTVAQQMGKKYEMDDELFHHRLDAETSHCYINPITPTTSQPPPKNLPNVVLQMKLPLSFRNLCEIFLDSNKSQFRIDNILKHELHYKNVSVSEWDHHNDEIGRTDDKNPTSHHHNTNDQLQEKYIGAIRQTNYEMPKTSLVEASMAYETAVLTKYNDSCFVIRSTTSTPTVPFGERFISITQIVVIKTMPEGEDDDSDTCEMIVSVDVQYPKVKPMRLISNRIRNGVIQGAKAVYEKTSEVILSRFLSDEQ